MTAPLITAQGLTVAYGAHVALTEIDFTIGAGEIVTVVGPNGSGKSTLLKALVGLVPATRGRIVRKANLRVGYVPQRLELDWNLPLTVGRFLRLFHRLTKEEMETLLARVGFHAATLLSRRLDHLSGGQFQRVLLAQALARQPELLVLDEPTRGLDQPATAAFYRLLATLRAQTGCAVLMVSHDLHVVMAASDRVVCINRHICCQGKPEVVALAPEYRALFGLGTQGTMALYRHMHDHVHDPTTEFPSERMIETQPEKTTKRASPALSGEGTTGGGF